MRSVLLLSCALVLGACSFTQPLPRPPEGYAALRFKERVELGVGRLRVIPPGTVLVADQQRSGEPVYCGMVTQREPLSGQIPVFDCVTWRPGNRMAMGAARALGPQYEAVVPEGAVEEIRLR